MRRKRPIYADTYTKRRRYAIIAVVVAVVVAAIGCGWWLTHKNPRPSARRYPTMGVRVDQTDGVLDAASIRKGGASYVYLKATQGASFVDDNYATNVTRATGLSIGAYHYYSFDSTPQAQAANFIKHVASAGDLPIAIYLTYYGSYASDPPDAKQLAANLKALMAALNAQYTNGCILMGTPAALDSVQPYLKNVGRYVLSAKQPKDAAYWEYATAKLPGGGDKSYRCSVKVKEAQP